MTEPLEPEESAWLDAHLVGCESCREIDTAYRSDREYLRAMRVIPPPRDLWARTSVALDAEQSRSGGGRRSRPARRRTGATVLAFPRERWAPVGALGSIAAVMVVGFLLGNMLIGVGPAGSPSIVALGPSATPNLVPTPIKVPQADVAWVSTNTDGSIVVRQAPVSDVCPANDPAGCAPFDRNASPVVTLSVKPKSVHQSPTSGQMIVFGQTPTGLSMYVIDTGTGAPPTPTPSVKPTTTPTTPPTATPTASTSPPTSPGGPSTSPSSVSPGSPTPTTPASSWPTASVTSTAQTSSSPTPEPTSTATIVPNVTPPPSAATLIAVASDLGVLNSETAAYSPDGAWFAFTARPLNQTTSGSDIYLWHAGASTAKAVSDDHRSVFAGWVGNRLLGSRAVETVSGAAASTAPASASSDAEEFATSSFLVNPATLERTSVPAAAWRPSVDPTGRFVVYWEGTVARDPLNGGWRSATGRLVLRAWPIVAAAAPVVRPSPSIAPASPSVAPSPSAASGASASPSSTPGPMVTRKPAESPSASPSASVAPSASSSPSVPPSPTPSVPAPAGLPDGIGSASGVDWAVAWDETGTHLAVWIGDSGDRSFGRLHLLTIGANGMPATGGALLSDQPALPGFSLADGHLAWATPVGVNGNGSQLKIYAYSGSDAGVNSGQEPSSGTVIVVQH